MQLTIQNFRSFTKPQEFTLPEGPGLYFMRGSNLDESRLDANGSGKSSTWDALTWLLYGKTARGLRASDVCNWGAEKGTRVSVEWLGSVLTRTWGPVGFKANGADADADLGKQITGLDYKSWLHCVLMAQAQPMFLDLKADAKAALFSEVLGLDMWLQRAQKAAEVATSADKDVRAAERDLAGVQGRLSSLYAQDVQVQEKDWAASNAADVARLVTEYESLVQKHEVLFHKNEDAKRRILEEKAKLVISQVAVEADTDELTRGRKFVKQWSDEVVILTHRAAHSKEMQGHASRAHCPWCDQDIPAPHSARTVKTIENETKQWEDELKKAKAKLHNAELDVEDAEKDLRASTDERYNVEREITRSTDEVVWYTRDLDWLNKRMDEIETEVTRLESLDNPFADVTARINTERQVCEEEINGIAARLQAAEERKALAGLWARGFKEVRLHAIGEALAQLELEVNSGLTALGLLGWEMKFDVDRETRAGTLQRGFAVTVTSPKSSRPVSWEAWSGGEAQRLRLAATMGLAALIRAQTETKLQLEVWDEPTAFLSAQGVQDVLDALRARADAESRQIWVVDHRSLSYGGFDGTVTVVKDAEGSRFVWET